MYQCKFGVEKFTGSVDRAQKIDLQFFNDGEHKTEVTLKTRSKSPNHINSLFCHNDTIHKSLARIH